MGKHSIVGVLLFIVTTLVQASPLVNNPLYCMMANIYHEARGEALEGKIAVANVVMNRVTDKNYPNNVCDVVYQRKQFSWTLDTDKLRKRVKFDYQTYKIAMKALTGKLVDYTQGATHYHTVKVNPYWTNNKVYLTRIGNHVFYKRTEAT
jgi:N-acetylmuramoyl-L-alanine amidase